MKPLEKLQPITTYASDFEIKDHPASRPAELDCTICAATSVVAVSVLTIDNNPW